MPGTLTIIHVAANVRVTSAPTTQEISIVSGDLNLEIRNEGTSVTIGRSAGNAGVIHQAGRGAIASGPGAVASGAGGIATGGNMHGSVIIPPQTSSTITAALGTLSVDVPKGTEMVLRDIGGEVIIEETDGPLYIVHSAPYEVRVKRTRGEIRCKTWSNKDVVIMEAQAATTVDVQIHGSGHFQIHGGDISLLQATLESESAGDVFVRAPVVDGVFDVFSGGKIDIDSVLYLPPPTGRNRQWIHQNPKPRTDIQERVTSASVSMLLRGVSSAAEETPRLFAKAQSAQYNPTCMIINVVKIFLPSTVAFVIGILLTPVLTHYLYKHKLWKKKAREIATDGRGTPLFNKLHKDKEVGTPKMGGIVIWGSVFLTILLFSLSNKSFPGGLATKLAFLSRNQTWLPLFTLLVGSLIGLVDDIFEVAGTGDYLPGGLSLKKRLFVVALTALIGGLWFFFKLGVASVAIPFVGELFLGWLFIPFFIAVMLVVYSGGVIDGIDGLAGGVFSAEFAAYGGIAFFQNQIDLAAFCALIVGGTLAFLWFNIPPARFYMSETGTMGLTMTLAVVAFLTKAVLVLPIIAFPLFATTASDIIQLASKKYRHGKKIFLIAPVHHHFEALGWPGYKVTMRYWVLSIVFAVAGMIIALIG